MKRITTFFVLLIFVFSCAGCEFNFTTANITDAGMTTGLSESGEPIDRITEYAPDAPEFLVVAKLNNAPENTQIRFVWNYVTSNEKITEMVLDSGNQSGVYISCNLTLGSAWPEGDYSVDIYVDDREQPDATVAFQVKAKEVTIVNAQMTTAVDSHSNPLDQVTVYSQDVEKFYVTAQLQNATEDLDITFVWYYLDNNEKVAEVPLNYQVSIGTAISCSLTNNGNLWKQGNYGVEIYIGDREQPDAAVTFSVQ